MATKNLESGARMLFEGKIPFGRYVGMTRAEYERIAAMLVRRWRPPAWVEQEDVVQDLFAATWESIWGYDASRGKTVGDYVVYNSISRAKRCLHKARGAILHGSPDRNPSRFELPISAFSLEDRGGSPESIDEMISRLARRIDDGWDGSPEGLAIDGEDRAASVRIVLATCATDIERRVVGAIVDAGADMEEAGRRLCADRKFAAPLRIGRGEIEVMVAVAASIAGEVVGRLRTGEEVER